VASGAPRRIFCTITPVDRSPGEPLGRGEPDEFHALFLGIRDLALDARHVRPVAAVEAFDARRALPDAVRTQSIAVSPPPITTTRLPSAFSVSVVELRHLVAEALRFDAVR
jgi:hypothetical protein